MRFRKIFKKFEENFQKFVRKPSRKKLFRRIILGLGLFIIGLAVLFFSYNLVYQDKIFPHTYIGGTNFGSMNRDKALATLNQKIENSKNNQLNYSWAQKTYNLKTSDLELNYQNFTGKTADQLMAVGRTGGLGEILLETIRSMFLRNNIQAAFSLNEGKLDNYLASIAKDIDRPEKDATIEIKEGKPSATDEEVGQKFEISENKRITLEKIGIIELPQNLPFQVTALVPKIDRKTAEAAIPKTEELIGRQITLKARDKTYELKSGEIAGMIDFVARKSSSGYSLNPEISPTKVSPTVEKIAQDVYQEPKDPKFKASSGKVVEFQVGQTGYELDKTKSTSDIINAVQKNQTPVELVVKVTEPALAGSDPEEMGLKELVGEGSTSWRGSPQNRIHNLTLGAQNISGSIVKPGEEFSTVKAIGPITSEAGFLPELVIKNSTEVVPEIGGGLCQVSTTLFRAVLNSGLNITARTPHSFRVSYYEPPVGMDATIYDPAPDFRFINNMSTPIFIWAVPSSTGLDFQIYGTKDGRKIEISDPTIYDYTSPPAPVYTQSDTMAAGEIRQTERATSGATASFTYKVTDASGTVLQSETYVSKYVALPDSYLYGPGTPDIPGQQTVPAPQVEATQVPTPAPTATKAKR